MTPLKHVIYSLLLLSTLQLLGAQRRKFDTVRSSSQSRAEYLEEWPMHAARTHSLPKEFWHSLDRYDSPLWIVKQANAYIKQQELKGQR